MKKIFILTAAVLAMASCGNKTQTNENSNDSTAVATEQTSAITEEADSIAGVLDEQLSSNDKEKVAATMTAIKERYEYLVKQGKTEEARVYAEKLKTYCDGKAEEIKKIASGDATINELVDGITSLPTSVEQGADNVKNAAESKAKAAADEAESKVNELKDNAKQSVKDAENKAKQTVKESKDNAKKKVRESANKAVNDALNKAFGN